MTNVVCIKQGRLYGPHYANILYNSLRRNSTIPFRFVCFTDDREGLDPAIEARPFPYMLRGWWCKIPLFAPAPCIADDQIVAIDLDVVITGNIDWLLTYRGDFCAVRDWTRSKYYNGSLWSLRAGKNTHVWEKFVDQGDEVMKTYYSDQEWIREQIPQADTFQDLFPGNVLSFAQHFNNLEKPEFSKEASIYLFHGFPKPSEAAKRILWVREHWR